MPRKFKFEPNKRIDGPLTDSNLDRANRAEILFVHYGGKMSDESKLRDMISDILHLMDREGRDTREELDSAVHRWEEER